MRTNSWGAPKWAVNAGFIIAVMYFIAALAALTVNAQTCPVPIPPSPPKAKELHVKFTNPDGGSRPCEVAGIAPGGAAVHWYPVTQGARCDTAKTMADQAVANDNGWNDGGNP